MSRPVTREVVYAGARVTTDAETRAQLAEEERLYRAWPMSERFAFSRPLTFRSHRVRTVCDVFSRAALMTSLCVLTLSAGGSATAGAVYLSSEIDVYSIALDGKGLRNLTRHVGYDGEPVPSPNGERIAFISDRGGEANVYTMRPDGSDVRRVTRSTSSREPVVADGYLLLERTSAGRSSVITWSPDGRRLAFDGFAVSPPRPPVCQYYCWHPAVFVAAADGSGVSKLAAGAARPAWSPDGRAIAYTLVDDEGVGREMRVTTLGGGTKAIVLRNPYRYFFDPPVWSANSKRLVFAAGNARRLSVYVASRPSYSARWLAGGYDPTPAPDGKAVAFARREGVYTIGVDGRGRRRIARTPFAVPRFPMWFNNRTIVFATATRDYGRDLFRVARNGGGRRWITGNRLEHLEARRLRGGRVVYEAEPQA